MVAALHDVLEDSELTAEDLRAAGLSEVELEAVLHLTKREGEPYEEYIERVATADGEAGELARKVKLADLQNNLSRLTPEFEHMRERYEKALARLEPRTDLAPVLRNDAVGRLLVDASGAREGAAAGAWRRCRMLLAGVPARPRRRPSALTASP